MLKIETVYSQRFTNALHVQYATEVKNVTLSNNPTALGILSQYDDFVLWYDREDDAYKFVRKSEITEEKAHIDHARDEIFIGMRTSVVSSIHHYNPVVSAAARRLMVTIDGFNKPEPLIHMSYDAETAAITSLLQDLAKKQDDVNRVNIQGWIAELDAKNKAFEALAGQYIENDAEKPAFNMLHARRGVEKSMRTMFDCVNALIVMNGEEAYTAYVNSLNAIIKHYNEVYAVHIGRYEANKDKGSEGEE
jgi:hypothetical protein